ncbi:hypothetical protein PFISCL1PPCAC_10591, partial [Pristionchus fissidentatus]
GPSSSSSSSPNSSSIFAAPSRIGASSCSSTGLLFPLLSEDSCFCSRVDLRRERRGDTSKATSAALIVGQLIWRSFTVA